MKRTGLTLIELLLVLAIMLVALSLAVPSMTGMIESRAIQTSVEQVRNALQEARVTALRTGQTQQVLLQMGERGYAVRPWLQASDEAEAGVGATIMLQTGQTVQTESTQFGMMAGLADPNEVEAKKIEEGVVFADVQLLNDLRTAVTLNNSALPGGMGMVAEPGASQPILFYPDGTASTAHIVIQNERGRRMAIQVRGITGQISVFDLLPAGGL